MLIAAASAAATIRLLDMSSSLIAFRRGVCKPQNKLMSIRLDRPQPLACVSSQACVQGLRHAACLHRRKLAPVVLATIVLACPRGRPEFHSHAHAVKNMLQAPSRARASSSSRTTSAPLTTQRRPRRLPSPPPQRLPRQPSRRRRSWAAATSSGRAATSPTTTPTAVPAVTTPSSPAGRVPASAAAPTACPPAPVRPSFSTQYLSSKAPEHFCRASPGPEA